MKKYIEIYDYFKEQITTNLLKENDKMPSLRAATEIFAVSKTTIENAYFALQADGYIIASAKSGYYVCHKPTESSSNDTNLVNPNEQKAKYDFKSGDADKESFDIQLWQRYIKNALRQQEKLLSYSDVQGELELRQALVEYIRDKRNVITSAQRIVIGAGVQSLLHILCSLLPKGSTVSFPDKSFIQGMSVFDDYGYKVKTRYKDANIIYVSPSHMTGYGDVMSVKRRIELVNHSKNNNSIVIEDDYDNDFVYQSKLTPSLFALSGGKNVVYMGSFSNVLIPSIRISFMVLTEDLYNKYKSNISKYAQTASKTEQIALSQYIRDGHIKSQTRRIRRHYTAKASAICKRLQQELNNAKCTISDNGLQIKIEIPFNKDLSVFEENSLSVKIESYDNDTLKLVLVSSAIETKDIDAAVDALKTALL